MIEFILLFALGFLAAALVALILAPIIQRRVVRLTERRIRASVPLSAAEIRAEKDLARAAFAAENARLSVDLKHNRDQLSESLARGSRLSNELVALRAEKISTEKMVQDREADIRDLHSQVNDRDAKITTLTASFGDAARLAEARKHEIAARDDQINRLGTEIEELRIDLVTLDTEAENFKSQIRELRTERNAMRDSLKAAESSSRDLENRLKSTEEKLSQSEARLSQTISTLSDRENALERRVAEVDRYKKKNRELSDELRAAKKAAREAAKEAASLSRKAASSSRNDNTRKTPKETAPAGNEAPARTPQEQREDGTGAIEQHVDTETGPDLDQLSEDEKIDRLRARQAALIERLMKADNDGNDAALRRELAVVAAMMVELSASRDGSDSPVLKIIRGSEALSTSSSSEPSLAARTREMLASH